MDQPSPEPVILMCPCCGTAVDTLSDQREHECSLCGQTWTMQVDLQRMAEHAL